jgi:hypothetical protein
MGRDRTSVRAAIAAAVMLAGTAAPAAGAQYTAQPGPYRERPKFIVTYSGSGNWRTVYHATPPSDPANPDGPHDTNDANDSSIQHWTLRFGNALSFRPCTVGRCPALGLSTRATGSETVVGTIAHTHVDGLYPADDQSVSCTVNSALSSGLTVDVRLRYLSSGRAISLTAFTPVAQALTLLPPACPGQTDAVDGLYDNYFTPGFSFAAGYGPSRWFTSQNIVVRTRVLRRSKRIMFQLHDVPGNTPPTGCAVTHPSYERCTTGGAWTGLLQLTRVS